MKTIIALAFAMCLSPLTLKAQYSSTANLENNSWFNHVDLGVSLGTTGIGIEVASPISEYAQLRAGFSYMPKFDYKMTFCVSNFDDEGNLLNTKFDKLQTMMKDFTGYDVDQYIDMIGQPTYYNFNLLVDVFPFPDKRWHVTGGVYIGPSKFAKAYNTTEDMPSLMAVGIYNNIYKFFHSDAYLDDPLYDSYYLDPLVGDQIKEKLEAYGRMGIQVGTYTKDGKNRQGKEYKKGDPYIMEPDANGMVKAKILVNRLKPYLGFGYNGCVSKDEKTFVSCDLGVMFWGGTPQIITHDGTDLAHDVENINWSVGDYVDFAKSVKVFPVISVKISRRLF